MKALISGKVRSIHLGICKTLAFLLLSSMMRAQTSGVKKRSKRSQAVVVLATGTLGPGCGPAKGKRVKLGSCLCHLPNKMCCVYVLGWGYRYLDRHLKKTNQTTHHRPEEEEEEKEKEKEKEKNRLKN